MYQQLEELLQCHVLSAREVVALAEVGFAELDGVGYEVEHQGGHVLAVDEAEFVRVALLVDFDGVGGGFGNPFEVGPVAACVVIRPDNIRQHQTYIGKLLRITPLP